MLKPSKGNNQKSYINSQNDIEKRGIDKEILLATKTFLKVWLNKVRSRSKRNKIYKSVEQGNQ